MPDDKSKKSKKKKITPNEELEMEVIRATKPKQVKFIRADDTVQVVEILPLPESILTDGSEMLSKIFTPIANEVIAFSVQADNVRRLAAGGSGSEGKANGTAAAPAIKDDETLLTPEQLESIINILNNVITPAKLQKVFNQVPGAIQYFIEVGTTLDYADVKDDILVAIVFVGKVLIHNIGPRLHDFLAQDFRRIVQAVGGIGQRPA